MAQEYTFTGVFPERCEASFFTVDVSCAEEMQRYTLLYCNRFSLLENQCFIEGWDCSFTTDLTRLQSETSINRQSDSGEGEKQGERESLEELLLGFLEFYAKLDFSLKVICLQPGKSVDLNSFSEQMKSDPRLKDFKVRTFEDS